MSLPNPTWTVADLVTHYRGSRHSRLLAAATRRNTEKAYRWLEPFNDRLLDTIEKSEMSAVIDGLPPGNAHVFLSRTRALFSYARSLDQMTKDPCSGLTTPSTGEYRPWTQEEVDTFLKGSSDMVGMAVKLAYYTGQRMSDVLTMKWDHIKDGGIDVVQMKTKAPLHIPLHPKLKAALRKHAKTSKSDYIISMTDGRPYTPHKFRQRFRDARIALGLPKDLVFHGIRKLMAVNLADAGASTQEIMAVGGWKTSRQVDHYCKGSNQRKLAATAIGKMGAL